LASHWLDRARRELDEGRVREALDHIDRALELDPRNATALVAAGVLHSRHGDTVRARMMLERALELGEDDVVALTVCGALELTHGSAHSSRRFMERAHALSGSPVSAANLGATMLALGEADAARELLRGVVDAHEKVPAELHANLAFAELAGGDVAAARLCLTKALIAGADAGNPRIVALDQLIAMAEADAPESADQ
jgi:Flp pilus assembly protein TadD